MFVLDSREIQPGDTFICLPGGEPFISDAKNRGAKTIKHLNRPDLAKFANEIYRHPSEDLTVVGITGTNGKTTVAHWVHQALSAVGYKSMVQGTLENKLTTPESIHTLGTMRAHLDKGGTHFVMEVSSHAIDQGRIDGIAFDVRCLTNLSQDHLDYHKTLEAYYAVKRRFVAQGDGITEEHYKNEPIPAVSGIMGDFNKNNLKAAAAILRACGLSETERNAGLKQVTAPPGRFEPVDGGQKFLVVLDFAHTPDALEKILTAGRKLAQQRGGRLSVLFGCGGDRDRRKRPLMGAIAEKLADHICLTQDNPRHERPQKIISDILSGIEKNEAVTIIQDRVKAIEHTLSHARDNDVIILAGKGHETVQIIGNSKHPHSDKNVALTYLKKSNLVDLETKSNGRTNSQSPTPT